MEQLNQLKEKLIQLRLTGINVSRDTAQKLQSLTRGLAIGSVATLDVAGATSNALAPVSYELGHALAPVAQATIDSVVVPSMQYGLEASIEADRMGLLAPSVASATLPENPLLGSFIAADIASNTNSDIRPAEGYVKIQTPSVTELNSLKLLKYAGGNISRRKLLRKRRVSRNRK